MRLRLARFSDAAGIAAIYAPIVRETTISFEETAPGTDEMAERMAALGDAYPWLVAVDDGGPLVLGYAYALRFRTRAAYRWSVETAVYVAPRSRRNGVGSRLYAALFRLLSAQGYRRAFAAVTLPNEGSLAAHRAAGFRDAGVWPAAGWKFGAWHDVQLLERALGAGSAGAPAEPIGLSALGSAGIAAALAG